MSSGGEMPDFSRIQRTVSSWKDLGNFTLDRGTVLYRKPLSQALVPNDPRSQKLERN